MLYRPHVKPSQAWFRSLRHASVGLKTVKIHIHRLLVRWVPTPLLTRLNTSDPKAPARNHQAARADLVDLVDLVPAPDQAPQAWAEVVDPRILLEVALDFLLVD